MEEVAHPPNNPIHASIIIRTYNEEEYLGETLEMVFKQKFANFEVIIIDSGSTDHTLQIAIKYPVIIKEIPKETFTYGYALNFGGQLAKGEFLVFLSGHSLPYDAKWLLNLIEPFSRELVVGVCGKQTPHPGVQYSEKLRVEKAFDKPRGILSPDNLVFSNSNSAIRKESWESLKFDEKVEHGEDLIWARVQIAQGKGIYFQRTALVFHSHHFSWRRLANKATNDYLFFLRYHEPIVTRHEKLPSLFVYLIKALYAIKSSLTHFLKIHRINPFDFWDYWRTNFIYRTVRYQINQKLLADPNYLSLDGGRFTYIK